jgi:hypothetical protein
VIVLLFWSKEGGGVGAIGAGTFVAADCSHCNTDS